MQFSCTGAIFKRFLEYASIGFRKDGGFYDMQNIIVEVTEDGLFHSGINSGIGNAWAMVSEKEVASTASGIFTLSAEVAIKIIKLLKDDKEYLFSIEGNKININSDSTSISIDLRQSSHVVLREWIGENNAGLRTPSITDDDYIPLRPPPIKNGKMDGKSEPYENVIEIETAKLKRLVKLAHSLKMNMGEEYIKLSADEVEGTFNISFSSGSLQYSDVVASDIVTDDWETSFTHPIFDVVSLLSDTVKIHYTNSNNVLKNKDKYEVGNGKCPITFSYDEGNFSFVYWIAPYEV